MPSEAKRSRGAVVPAICDLQGDFQKLQGEPILCLSSFLMFLRCWKEFSRAKEQGAFFWYCREEQRGIANGSRVGARAKARLNAGARIAEITPRSNRNQRIATAAEKRG
jgi:hypothetical protein